MVVCLKDETFELLLAPSEWDFVTYRWIDRMVQTMGFEFCFEEYHIVRVVRWQSNRCVVVFFLLSINIMCMLLSLIAQRSSFRNEHIAFLHIVFYPLNPCPKLFSSLNDMPK